MNIPRKLARLLLLSITTLAIGYFALVRIGILPVQAAVGINKQINFQGKVTNSDGTNVTNGSYTFVFSLYTASSGGGAVWTETKSLTVTDGVFRTALGDTQTLPGSVDFNSNNIYLGVNFNSDGEMTPRIQFTAAPYAFNSDTLDGLDSTSFLRSDTSAAYTAGTLTFNSGTTLSVNGDLAVGDTSVTFSAGSTVLNFTSSNGPHQIVTAGTSNFALMPGGKVGIGYTAPGTKLTIAGGLAVGNSAGTSAYVTKLAPDGGAIFEGNVGIGTTNPSLATLQVEGTIRVGTTATATATHLCLGANNVLAGCSGGGGGVGGSGTGNYIAMWSDASNITSSALYQSSTFIGLGYTAPGSKLTVAGGLAVGNSAATSAYMTKLAPDGGAIFEGNVGLGVSAPTTKLHVNGGLTVGYGEGTTQPPSTGAIIAGFVGIGATTPGTKLTVSGGLSIGTSSAASTYLSKLAPDGGAIFEGNIGLGVTSPNTKLSINGNAIIGYGEGVGFTAPTNGLFVNGNVGIGSTANTLANLDISGTLRIGSTVAATTTQLCLGTNNVVAGCSGGTITGGGVSGQVTFWNGTATITGDNGLWWNNTNKFLGLGYTAPASKLSVVGGISVGFTVSASKYAAKLAPDGGAIFEGNVGIGTSTPGTTLDVTGTGRVTSSLIVNSIYAGGNGGNSNCLNYGDSLCGSGNIWFNTPGNLYFLAGDQNAQGGSDQSHFLTFGNSGGSNKGYVQIDGTYGGNAALTVKQAMQGTADIFDASNSAGLTLFRVQSTGNIAIGSSDATNTLTVQGTANVTGNMGIGITSPNSKLSINGGLSVGYGEGTTSAPTTGAMIAGNVGIGTSTPVSALNVVGDVTIGQEPDSTAGTTFTIAPNTVAGTFASQAAVTGAYASVIFKGKVFVATKKNDSAGVYRLDAGGWTLVTNAAGKAISGDTANIDTYAMTVFNGGLYIGSQTSLGTGGSAAVYVSTTADTTADSFTMINATRGNFDGTTAANTDVSDMEVYNGNLYVFGAKTNAAGIYRYNGGTNANAFTMINAAVGKFASADTADIDSGVLQVYGGRLYAGAVTGSTTARVAEYDGKNWTNLNSVQGTFDATASEPDVTSMAVFNGSLFVATKKTGAANIYRFNGGPAAGVATSSPFRKVNAGNGQILSTDPASMVTSVVMHEYNGRFYVGTNTGTGNSAAMYEYDPTIANSSGSFTMINSARGTFGSQTNIDAVDSLTEYNGTLYVGTEESTNLGAIYTWYKNSSNSYALKFDSGSTNYGEISFVGTQQVANHAGHMGTFMFSNAIAMVTGAFDYAEDYPTVDDSLEAGDIVQIDPENKQYVRKSQRGGNAIGIISEKPGFRLSLQDADKNGVTYLPVALVGRVPVKVSTENGAIAAGDYLMPSNVPGVAMRATTSGMIIGQAMEAYSGEGIGKITVFVQTSQFNGNLVAGLRGLDPEGAALTNFEGEESGERILKLIMKKQEANGLTGVSNSEIFTDRVVAQNEVIAPKIFADTVYAHTIKADSIEGLAGLIQKASTQSAVLATDSKNTVEATPAAVLALTKLPGLEVEGTATVSANLHVGGSTLIEGVLNVVDSITGTNLIVGKWADFLGSVIFRSDVNFLGRPVFNKDTAGFAVIKKDAQRVDVVFEKEYVKKPVINANLSVSDEETSALKENELHDFEQKLIDAGYMYFISKAGTKGFTIVLNKPATQDLRFSWVALAVSDASTSESIPAVLPASTKVTETPAISPSVTVSPTEILMPTKIATDEVSAR